MARPTKADPVSARPNTAELGVTGLRQYGGYIQEEFLRQLQGDKALQLYSEMLNNSPVVGGVLFLIDMHMRRVPWKVQPGGEDATSLETAAFVESCMHDMSMGWEDTLSEILSLVPFGWSYHETVYKYRQGGDPLRPGTFSRYTDGMIGWRKLPIRAQVTRWKWQIATDGGIEGMWQLPPNGQAKPIFIPIQKALLFRRGIHKNNPEGKSALRTAYRPYHFLSRIEEIEGIGIERDLAGLPVAKIPAEIIKANGEDYQAWQKAIRNVRRNEQDSLIVPSNVDPETKLPYYSVELLSTGSRRQFDLNQTIERYEKRIALSMLADFLFLGQSGVGSHAQTQTRASIFATALDALLDQVCDVFNRHAIPRLLSLNGLSMDNPPYMEHEPTETPDMQVVADAIAKVTAAGMPLFPDPKVENVVRHYLSLPEMNEDEIAERESLDQEQALLDQQMQQAALEGQVAAANQTATDAKAQRDQALKFLDTFQKRELPQPIHLHMPPADRTSPETMTIHVEQEAPIVKVEAAQPIVMPAPRVDVHVPTQEAPRVTVTPQVHGPDVVVHVPKAEPRVTVNIPKMGKRKKRTQVLKDQAGEIIGTETTEEDAE